MLMPQLISSRSVKHSSRLITKKTAQFEGEIIEERGRRESECTRSWNDSDDTMKAISEERLQDFLMPGLRHAHTLQQLIIK